MLPKVSVIMPVYNPGPKIVKSICSVLRQVNVHFELIIIDDGCEPEYRAHFWSFNKDPRVKIIVNDTNLDVAESLKRGINMARGEFIARLDAGDLMQPNRLWSQVKFLENYPNVAVVGTGYKACFLKSGREKISIKKGRINFCLIWKNCLHHSTVMFKKQMYESVIGYQSKYRCEDYDLWIQFSVHYDLYLIPEVLNYTMEEHDSSITLNNNLLLLRDGLRIRYAHLKQRPILMLGMITGVLRYLQRYLVSYISLQKR